jgi:hypothetical protein
VEKVKKKNSKEMAAMKRLQDTTQLQNGGDEASAGHDTVTKWRR